MSKFGKYLWKILILICLLEVGTLDMQAGKDKDVAYLREKVTEQLLDVPIMCRSQTSRSGRLLRLFVRMEHGRV